MKKYTQLNQEQRCPIVAHKKENRSNSFIAKELGVLLEEARLKLGMTQEQLAEKCGTNKSYISRIEHNASDIRLSTLMKLILQL